MSQQNNPLHGIKLETVLTYLVDKFGWEELGLRFNLRCFTHDPSIKSSLSFLRKTPWARDKVEYLYLKANKLPLPPSKTEQTRAEKPKSARSKTNLSGAVSAKKPANKGVSKEASSQHGSKKAVMPEANKAIWGAASPKTED